MTLQEAIDIVLIESAPEKVAEIISRNVKGLSTGGNTRLLGLFKNVSNEVSNHPSNFPVGNGKTLNFSGTNQDQVINTYVADIINNLNIDNQAVRNTVIQSINTTFKDMLKDFANKNKKPDPISASKRNPIEITPPKNNSYF